MSSGQIKDIIKKIEYLGYSDEYKEYAQSALKALGVKKEKPSTSIP